MKLKILGTRGEIKFSSPLHSRHSGVLVDDKLLMDLGEVSFLAYKPKWILLTHLHPDHAAFLDLPLNFKIPVFDPESNKKPFTLGPYRITPIPTHHSKLMPSQAYRIDSKNCSILYTGDIIWIDKKYHHLFKGLDLVITDGSYFKKGGLIRRDPKTGKIFGHTGIPNLVDLFRPFTKKLLLIHFGSWFFKNIPRSRDQIKNLSKQKGIEILVGYDGMKLLI